MEDSPPPPKRHRPPPQNPPPTISQTLNTDDDIKEDRISNLPDSILSHILSKLPTKTAIATTVLSTKWKHLFASIPNLSLDIDDAGSTRQPNPNFVNFMYHLLTVTLCDVPSIRKFRLQCNHDHGNSHLDAWVSTVLGLKVSDLTLVFFAGNTGVSTESLFQCETLVRLIWWQHFYADVPDIVCLPNLKRLCLAFVKFPDFESFDIVISGCPVLEELSLDSCEFEETYVLSISSPSLKFLMLNNCNHDDFYEVVIDTPSLEVLDYDDHVASSYFGMNLNSLVRAYIDVGPSDFQVEEADDEDFLRYQQNVTQLVAACCNVDSLYLSMPAVTAIHRSSSALCTFQNLTKLKLGDLNVHGWEFLPHLLESAPNLETLVFMRGFMEHEGCFAKFESSISNSVPTCSSLNLRSIYFEEFNGEQDELELVSYFLKTAEVLREMVFSFCSSLPIEKQCITWWKLSLLQRHFLYSKISTTLCKTETLSLRGLEFLGAKGKKMDERESKKEAEHNDIVGTSWGKRRKRESARTELDILVEAALGVRRPEKEEFPDMPRDVFEKILGLNGEAICKVFQKCLTNTDVENNHNRLLMPALKLLNCDFLTQTEKDLLREKEGTKLKVN
ncbi:hypothetical protein Vadar_002476 [Vaccinium darrowii]|uniref:Uncharacterized protein n=1 Tax=Vaccinium darrowii TaxID=229202 RepID=A0ACB7Z1T4_9ERIC|nr:hypothetical protein Vadar_002476 [Vaccinium darrowii]